MCFFKKYLDDNDDKKIKFKTNYVFERDVQAFFISFVLFFSLCYFLLVHLANRRFKFDYFLLRILFYPSLSLSFSNSYLIGIHIFVTKYLNVFFSLNLCVCTLLKSSKPNNKMFSVDVFFSTLPSHRASKDGLASCENCVSHVLFFLKQS